MPTLEWIGKDKVINYQEVPCRILERQYSYNLNGKSSDDNGSENMIIHGDNVEVLKSLLPIYEGRIKCIYIDPPYNTGNESWIYNDNVNSFKIKNWLNDVVGEECENLSCHDKWLCMMYPRLKLLHKLLKDDGVIFISIKDNELYYLKLICDEIFGSKNFIENFVWYIRGHTDKQNQITHVHEYILCYAKSKENIIFNNIVAPCTPVGSKIRNSFAENSITKNSPKNPPSIIELPSGFPCEVNELYKPIHENVLKCIEEVKTSKWITRGMTKKYKLTYPARLDEMIVKSGVLHKPCRVYSGWMNNGKLIKFINNAFQPIEDNGMQIKFYLSKNGVIYYRREGRQSKFIPSILDQVGTTETNKYILENMGIEFDYPKPYTMIEFLLSIVSQNDSIILDSFAGSGTTAHAVLNMNKTDGGNRKFILIEMMDYAETITAERVKCVINGYDYGGNTIEGTGGDFSYYELGQPLMDYKILNKK